MKYMQNNELFVNNLIGFLCHIFTVLQDSPLKEKFNSILTEFIELGLFTEPQLLLLKSMITSKTVLIGGAVRNELSDKQLINIEIWRNYKRELKCADINVYNLLDIPIKTAIDFIRILEFYKNFHHIAGISYQYNERELLQMCRQLYNLYLLLLKFKDVTYNELFSIDQDILNEYIEIMSYINRNLRTFIFNVFGFAAENYRSTDDWKRAYDSVNTILEANNLGFVQDFEARVRGKRLISIGKLNPTDFNEFLKENTTQINSEIAKENETERRKIKVIIERKKSESAPASAPSSVPAPASAPGSVYPTNSGQKNATRLLYALKERTYNVERGGSIKKEKENFEKFIDKIKLLVSDVINHEAMEEEKVVAHEKCDPLIKLTEDQINTLTRQEYRQFLVEKIDKANLKNFQIDCEEFNCEPRRPGAAEVIPEEQIEKISRQLQQYDYLLAYLKEIIKNEKPEIDFTIYHCPEASPCINLVFHFDPYDENLSILDSMANAVKFLTIDKDEGAEAAEEAEEPEKVNVMQDTPIVYTIEIAKQKYHDVIKYTNIDLYWPSSKVIDDAFKKEYNLLLSSLISEVDSTYELNLTESQQDRARQHIAKIVDLITHMKTRLISETKKQQVSLEFDKNGYIMRDKTTIYRGGQTKNKKIKISNKNHKMKNKMKTLKRLKN